MHRAAAHSDGQVMLFSVGIVWRRMEHLIDQLQILFEFWSVLIVYSNLAMTDCQTRAFSQLAAVAVAISIRMPRSYQLLVHQQVHPSRAPTSTSQQME
jgi:hypothetical protein